MGAAAGRGDGEIAEVVELIEELQRASAEAEAKDHPRMGRLLHECGVAIDGASDVDRASLIERGRKALAVWCALRTL